MSNQEWVLEIIGEGIIGAINEFKEKRPLTLHKIATETTVVVASPQP